MSAVEQIKSRLDIYNVVSKYVPLKKAGHNYKAVCPFHSEKTPSFVVFPDTQTWRCFGQCGAGGDMFSFVMKMEGWEFREALQALANEAGVTLEAQNYRNKQAEDHEARLYNLLVETARAFNHALKGSVAEDYILNRGLTQQTIEEFQLGYAPDEWTALRDHLIESGYTEAECLEAGVLTRNDNGRVYDRFRHRFVIPIRDSRGRVVGFGARALGDDQQPKYLNSPQSELFDKSRLLYGFDMARRTVRERETVVIVEGYMDVIQAHQAGHRNVVATMGTALTREHIQFLRKYADKFIMALDSDSAGIKATMRGLEVAREALSDNSAMIADAKGVMQQAGKLDIDIRVLNLPYGKDPDDFIRHTPDAWDDQINNAQPLADYIIDMAAQDLPPNASIQEREKLAFQLLPLLTATENSMASRRNVMRLGLRLRLDEKALLERVNHRTHRPKSAAPNNYTRSKKSVKHAGKPQGQPKVMSLTRKGRALERYCLSTIIRDPERYFEGNRLLREIANHNPNLWTHPLHEEDFTQSDFQEVFRLFDRAMRQDDMEVDEFLMQHGADVLIDTLDEISREILEEYAQRASKRNVRELLSWQEEQRLRSKEQVDDFPVSILMLRRDRILRESQNLQFMLREAQANGDRELEQEIMMRFSSIPKTKLALDIKIQETMP